MFKLTRINNFKVIPRKLPKDNRPVKGSFMFPKAFCTTYVLGKKESGKTVVLDNIIQQRLQSNTTVVIFSSTLDVDDNWIAIQKWLEDNEIPHILHDSIYDHNGTNLLKDLVDQLLEEGKARRAKEKDDKERKRKLRDKYNQSVKFYDDPDDEEEQEKKPKFLAPDWLIIIDDLSDEVHDKSLETLIKKHRHFRSQIIISNQTLNDVTVSSRKNMDYWILFGDVDELKLQQIFERTSMNVSFEQFVKMYKFATKERYNFFYFSTTAVPDYRVNFDIKINVHQEHEKNHKNIKYLR